MQSLVFWVGAVLSPGDGGRSGPRRSGCRAGSVLSWGLQGPVFPGTPRCFKRQRIMLYLEMSTASDPGLMSRPQEARCWEGAAGPPTHSRAFQACTSPCPEVPILTSRQIFWPQGLCAYCPSVDHFRWLLFMLQATPSGRPLSHPPRERSRPSTLRAPHPPGFPDLM